MKKLQPVRRVSRAKDTGAKSRGAEKVIVEFNALQASATLHALNSAINGLTDGAGSLGLLIARGPSKKLLKQLLRAQTRLLKAVKGGGQ